MEEKIRESSRGRSFIPRILNSLRVAGAVALAAGVVLGLFIWQITDNVPLALLLGFDTAVGSGFVLYNLVEAEG
ncbi:MAG: hypothetical protein NVS2B16_07650 [Chloroflexota bacterium]